MPSVPAYGPGVQARQILIARRLLEKGVRFIQLWHGEGQPWDNHDDLEVNHRRLAGQCDRAIGALLKDLNARIVAGAGISPDDLMIGLFEGPGENFSFGQGLAQRAFISQTT